MQRRQKPATDVELPPEDKTSVADAPAETPAADTKPQETDNKKTQEEAPAVAPSPRVFYVRVKPGLKWQSVRSAGLVFSDSPVAIGEHDTAFKGIAANPYLQMSEEPTWPEQ